MAHPGQGGAEHGARDTGLIVAGLAEGSDPNLQSYLDDLLEQITAAAQTKDET